MKFPSLITTGLFSFFVWVVNQWLDDANQIANNQYVFLVLFYEVKKLMHSICFLWLAWTYFLYHDKHKLLFTLTDQTQAVEIVILYIYIWNTFASNL